MKKMTQSDMMYAQVKEIFGANFSIYSTNYYNPGRRYQLELIHPNSGASFLGANLTKGSFRKALEITSYMTSMTTEQKIDFWKRETNLKKYK